MVKEGLAEWVAGQQRAQVLVYWLKPEEWANLISNWVYIRIPLGSQTLIRQSFDWLDRRNRAEECCFDVV